MLLKKKNIQFRKTEYDGVERCVIWTANPAGGSAYLKMKTGARFPEHTHPGREQILLLEGKLRVGMSTLRPGDFILTEAGEQHDLEAMEDSLLFVCTEKGINIMKKEPLVQQRP
ncbi:cupin domain-containing protein [Limisalsivibrio acetivorans]|uniref:cupin domain-containing protein n=1 Tax=Limisalsivibrio acetivorans TaxID=1304888 RepID=UPI0003B656C9|nr:cupin domain-containing protein [Limisalsivibrio acetivorans]